MEEYKEGDEEADREYDGKTTPESGLALNGTPYREEWRKLVVISPVVPNGQSDYGIGEGEGDG